MQLGFVIDQSRCIGCHACTVACKSENQVPLGSFRTWVKYTETGEFPAVKRHFTVLRCNQCSEAPCVTICPTKALEKRPDGIVDVDKNSCIGCKSCMQGCPYDALYINTSSGTAEKCHFCAHRTERGLAPACAVVCPTEAIIPGDFHDSESLVSRLRREEKLVGRKPEAGTGPNVLYKSVDPSGVKPLSTDSSGGFLWADRPSGPQFDSSMAQSMESRATARTTYDVGHPPLWGGRVSAYLFTKSLAAGAFLAAYPEFFRLEAGLARTTWLAGLGLAFLALTTVLLVLDLKRPDRFLLILRRPNWSSWLVKGTVVLLAYGLALLAWLYWGFTDSSPSGTLGTLIQITTLVAAGLTACYTAFLFGQAKGRVLWMQRFYWAQLLVQASLAGSALLLLLAPFIGLPERVVTSLRVDLFAAALLQGFFVAIGSRLAPRGREAEYASAHRVLTQGPLAGRLKLGLSIGALVVALLPTFFGVELPSAVDSLAAICALAGLYLVEDAFVRSGQALPIS